MFVELKEKNGSFPWVIGPSLSWCLLACAVVPVEVSGQQSAPSDIQRPVLSRAQAHAISVGDILQISIYAGGEKQDEFVAEISPKGTMTSPLIGELAVEGLSIFQITEKMRELLKQNFFVDPQVLVNVKEYVKKVYVMGEVKNPGAYGIPDGLTTLNACILAGGFTDYAALSRVKVTRQENGRPTVVEINLGKVQDGRMDDLVLQGGDRIDVPPRRF